MAFSMPVSETLRREQVRAVGTAFLRIRPAVALVGVSCNAGLLLAARVPATQRVVLSACMIGLLALFTIEAWLTRTRSVTPRWLFGSLLVTAVLIALACGFSGGAGSPLVPLLFAPLGVAFAAFGGSRSLWLWLALGLSLLVALRLAGGLLPFPPIAAEPAASMTIVSAAAALVLLRIGVAGLTEAHARVAAALDELRAGVLAEAQFRAREAESLGAKVAHELKNPLASIKGLVQLLERGAGSERDRKRCEVALSEIERMLHALDDYLSFSRPLHEAALEPARLDVLAESLVTLLEPNAERQRVRIELWTRRCEALVDVARIKAALLNLATNALQAMPDGGVLRIEVSDLGARVQLSVCDSGAGMSPEALEHAGTPFFSGRAGGTGLGLALARGVARQHGGELTIESTPGSGTRVTLSIATRVEARS